MVNLTGLRITMETPLVVSEGTFLRLGQKWWHHPMGWVLAEPQRSLLSARCGPTVTSCLIPATTMTGILWD